MWLCLGDTKIDIRFWLNGLFLALFLFEETSVTVMKARSQQVSPRQEKRMKAGSSFASPNRSPQRKNLQPLNDIINSEPVDKFAPYLSRKLALKRQEKNTKPDGSPKITQPTIPSQNDTSHQHNGKNMNPSISYTDHLAVEKIFDNIAADAYDIPLNQLVETNFKALFKAERVSFFYDISAVNLLYCPSNTICCPHGNGLVGYCHFSRDVIILETACEHVSFNTLYDGNGDSHQLLFPIFDYQSHVKAVVVISRSKVHPMFNDLDEKYVQYLQSKFEHFSRWLFTNTKTTDINLADYAQAQRLSAFVKSVTTKLQRSFNCQTAELWQYDRQTGKAKQYTTKAHREEISVHESGVVGYSLSNLCRISLTACKLHSAYNQKSDGTGDQSILVLPVRDPDSFRAFAVVLRGKRSPHFFTDIDEQQLTVLAPIIISTLNSSQIVEKSYLSLEESMKAQERLKALLDVAENLSGELHIDELIPSIMNRACHLVKADRCSLFMVNDTKEKLVTSFTSGMTNTIEIPISSGIVGYTATTGEVLNISDAYNDHRFNRATDISTGYKTQTLLCVPIFDDKGEVRGVTEMINKIDGVFTKEDEKLMQVFNVFCGISIENARLYRASIDLATQVRGIIEISQSLTQTSTIKKLINDILKNSRKVIGAGRAMFYVIGEQEHYEISGLDEDIESKMRSENERLTQDPNGTKRALVRRFLFQQKSAEIECGDVEEGIRQNFVHQVFKTGESTIQPSKKNEFHSLMGCPIMETDKTVVGVLLMQWKKKETTFFEEDLKLLESFGVFIALSIERRNMRTFSPIETSLREIVAENEMKSLTTPEKLQLQISEKKMSITNDYKQLDEYKLVFWFFERLGLRVQFNIPSATLFRFIYKLRSTYNDAPYHNWEHAISCAQFITAYLANNNYFCGIEKLAFLLAALSHDADARGINENMIHSIKLPMTILLQSDNVVNIHHCNVLIHIISKTPSNIIENVPKEDLYKFWQTTFALMFAVDFQKHYEVLEDIARKRKYDESWHNKAPNKVLYQQLIMKTAVLAEIARPPFEHQELVFEEIMDEFCLHGRLDKTKGVFYLTDDEDRANVDKEVSKTGIFNSAIIPVFDEFASICPEQANFKNQLEENFKNNYGQKEDD